MFAETRWLSNALQNRAAVFSNHASVGGGKQPWLKSKTLLNLSLSPDTTFGSFDPEPYKGYFVEIRF